MLKSRNIALLDIGSSKIELLYGFSKGNSTEIVASSSLPYSGFSNGEFFEVDKLKDIVLSLIEQVENRIGKSIKKMYVSVPGEFTMVDVKRLTERFPRPRVVSREDMDNLLEKAEMESDSNDYININTSLIGFDADSYRPIDSKSMDDVITRSITGTISCIMCSRSFIDIFDKIFNISMIKEVKYISQGLAEAVYLTDRKERDKGVIICDIGYLTTQVMLARGDGIADMKSFSLGGAHILADYTMCFDIDFKSSENLLREVNLKIAPKGFEDYHVNTTRGITKFSMTDVNNITYERLDLIVDYINKCIESFGDMAGQFMPIYFTGGGVTTIKGAIEYIAYKINRKYDIRVPNVVKYNFPWCSSSIAGLDMASRIEENSTAFRKLFNKLFGG